MKFSKRRKRYLKSRIPILRDRGLSNSEIAVKLGISERLVYRLQSTELSSSVTFFPRGNARHSKATRALAVRGARLRTDSGVRCLAVPCSPVNGRAVGEKHTN